jgi:DNA-binding MarR family transcriptional regulator
MRKPVKHSAPAKAANTAKGNTPAKATKPAPPAPKPPAPKPPANLQEEIGKKQPFEIAEQEAYLNILRTCSHAAREFAVLFRDHGLSDPQYNALRIVGSAGDEGIRSETIRERMVGLDSDVTRLVDRLQEARLVVRRRCQNDARCVYVTATPSGRALLKRVQPKADALHREQFGHMSRADLDVLNRLLFSARSRVSSRTRER